MSQLYKVAKMFQKKLSFAAASNLQNLTSVYRTSETLGKTKDLWADSGKDPYGDADPNISKAIDNLVGVGRRGYSQATTQGMPTKGQFGYAEFLTNMDKGIQALEAQGPFPSLDPNASSALAGLKQALEKARSEFVPVGIPSPAQHVDLPQDTVYGTPPRTPAGAAYQESGGADPAALHGVVEDLANKNNPPGPPMKRDWDALFNQ